MPGFVVLHDETKDGSRIAHGDTPCETGCNFNSLCTVVLEDFLFFPFLFFESMMNNAFVSRNVERFLNSTLGSHCSLALYLAQGHLGSVRRGQGGVDGEALNLCVPSPRPAAFK